MSSRRAVAGVKPVWTAALSGENERVGDKRSSVKAVVWHGTEDVRVDDVPDPAIQHRTDAIVRITSTAICGSDLHL